MLLVAAVVAILIAGTAEGALGVRVVAGTIAGLVSAAVFVVFTVLINRYKPDHW